MAAARSGDGLRLELGGQAIGNAQRGAVSSETIGFAIAALVLLLTFGRHRRLRPADRHRAVRARHLRRARRRAGGGRRHAGLGRVGRRDDRDRRRHRLRAADPHALPHRTGARARRPRRDRRGGHARGAQRAGGREHGRDLDARPVRRRPPLPLRRRALGNRRRARRDGRFADAPAGAARLRARAREPAARAVRRPRGGRPGGLPRRALEPRRAAPPVAARPPRRWPCSWCSPRRSRACGSPIRTRATTRAARRPARPTTSSATRSARVRAGRSSWPRNVAPGQRAGVEASRHGCTVPGVAAVSTPAVNRAGDAAVITVTATTSPQDTRTETLVHEVRDTLPPNVYVGGARLRRSTRAPRPRRGCRCSSAPSSGCR